MKADQIIRNAKIFTADKEKPLATALAVKDGKFVYAGDEAGLSMYEGEVTDLGGKFIMPGIIDSHVHVTMGAAFEYTDMGTPIQCDGKKEALDYMADYVRNNPGLKCYRFVLERKFLKGEEITRKDLDTICPDSDLLIMEGEAHSVWVNSSFLKRLGVTDDTPDPVPGLSYFVRKDGHVTGNIFETAEMRFLLDGAMELTDAQLDEALTRWIDYSVVNGVVGVFDAGIQALSTPAKAVCLIRSLFIAPLFRMSENQTMGGGRNYTYFFTPESGTPLIRCGHGLELSVVFNHPEETLVTGGALDETFCKILRKMWVQFAKTGNPSLSAEKSPDGKAHEWPMYDTKDRYVMVFDEFNIHSEKEAGMKILDWERTYFLTKYYCI